MAFVIINRDEDTEHYFKDCTSARKSLVNLVCQGICAYMIPIKEYHLSKFNS